MSQFRRELSMLCVAGSKDLTTAVVMTSNESTTASKKGNSELEKLMEEIKQKDELKTKKLQRMSTQSLFAHIT